MKKALLSNQILKGLEFGANLPKPKLTPNESLTPEPSTPVIQSTIQDIQIAIEAADTMARRTGETVVIQEDLSIVCKKDATKRILETVRSF